MYKYTLNTSIIDDKNILQEIDEWRVMNRKIKPNRIHIVRESFGLTKTQLARKARLQPGMLMWIETGRFIPYESQVEKIVNAFRSLGWSGDVDELFEEVV